MIGQGHKSGGMGYRLIAVFMPLLALLCLPTVAWTAVGFTIDSTPSTYVGGSGAQAIDGSATVQGDDFSNATLRVAIDPGDIEVAEDILQVLTRSPTLIANSGSITVNLGTGIVIGSYSGGTAGTDLEIILNSAVTPDQVRELLRSIAYLNLAGSTPTDANRSITFTMTKAAVTTVTRTRVINVDPGNALPGVVTNTGLTVARSAFVDLRNHLITDDADHTAAQLNYTLTALPSRGNLVRKSITGASLTVTDTFTQEDIDDGLIAYEHLGGPEATDSFTVVVSDLQGGQTPATEVDIVITGTVADPVIALPGPLLPYPEDMLPVALISLVDAGASLPVTSATVTDGDSPHFREATLEVAFLTVTDEPDGRVGDRLSVTDTPGSVMDGSVTVVGNTISYHLSGTTHAVATIDSLSNGTDGAALLITFLDTVIINNASTSYAIGEVITPAVVARVIERLTYASTDQDPEAAARLLRFTLREQTPNTGAGAAAVALAIQPDNDAPVFVVPATPTLNLTAVSGIALHGTVLASDPDSPTLTYALVSKSVTDGDATMVLDPVTGNFTFTPVLPFTGAANLVLSVTDSVAPPTQVTLAITTQAAPTSVNRPFITSDPPLEVEENASLFHNLVIAADPALGTLTSATLGFIGQLPDGLTATQLGGNPAIWTLTSSPLMRTTSGTYTFGVLVTANSTSGSGRCYQPITLRVRALGAAN